ncbi:hypothetical protein [Methylobacterium sp. ID0610]|uniref:hypothetical protein n=1 Tax=Methylobacterium carpenticola TaxID=3344827 RepID=UPI00369D1589
MTPRTIINFEEELVAVSHGAFYDVPCVFIKTKNRRYVLLLRLREQAEDLIRHIDYAIPPEWHPDDMRISDIYYSSEEYRESLKTTDGPPPHA